MCKEENHCPHCCPHCKKCNKKDKEDKRESSKDDKSMNMNDSVISESKMNLNE